MLTVMMSITWFVFAMFCVPEGEHDKLKTAKIVFAIVFLLMSIGFAYTSIPFIKSLVP